MQQMFIELTYHRYQDLEKWSFAEIAPVVSLISKMKIACEFLSFMMLATTP